MKYNHWNFLKQKFNFFLPMGWVDKFDLIFESGQGKKFSSTQNSEKVVFARPNFYLQYSMSLKFYKKFIENIYY